MARMPKGLRPRSSPAAIRASKMWFWYSSPWCSSQPSSPTKLTRSALVGAQADHDLLARQPGEGGAREIGVADPLQELARLGPGDHQHAHRIGEVLELDRAVARHVLDEPVMVEALPGAGRDQIEVFRAFAQDGELGMHPAPAVERVAEVDSPGFLRDAVGNQAIEKSLGAGAGDARLRERGHVEQADVLLDVPALVADVLEPLRAAERPVVLLRPCPRARTSSAAPSRTSGRTRHPGPSAAGSRAPSAAVARPGVPRPGSG